MLYGRAGEQAAIEALLTGAREGRSGALVLRGEAGIGKTALLDAAAEAAAPDFRVIRAAGTEYEAELPFAGLQLLLAPALDRLDALPAPQRRVLAGAFGLADPAPGDRLLLGLAAQGLLAEFASEQPLLALVDDAQWLDGASAEALLIAARRLQAEGVVLLFAARDGEGSFPAGGLATRTLTGLEPADAARLVPAALGPDARRRVLAEAHGNPLALVELPDAFAARRDATPGALPLPDRLRLAFHGRISRLPAATQTLLLVAAAEGTGDLGTVLAAAAALGAGPADLAPAEQSGLLRGGGEPVFRHPLFRTAVLQRAPLDQRLAVHRALAAALDGAGERPRTAAAGTWHWPRPAPTRRSPTAWRRRPAGRRPAAATPAPPPRTSARPGSPRTATRAPGGSYWPPRRRPTRAGSTGPPNWPARPGSGRTTPSRWP
ncbi:AAA family ATPase [Kitasatospora paranensis]|uniref:AAA family ATPase n=1 Tax=Kitasatospora paranensis TaxID=258053 RepID=UPI0031E9E436